MHEFSLARSVVRMVETRLAGESRRGVASITLRLGELAGVTAETLAAGFALASRGTVLEGARLRIEPAGGEAVEIVSFEVRAP
jgi:hydrogenase nickel incorporation protein HypA/HybF